MKLIATTIIILAICSIQVQAQHQPDTTKAPKIYWNELINIQSANQELTKRIHKLHMDGLVRDTLDIYLNYMGSLLPVVYKRTYADTVRKGKKK